MAIALLVGSLRVVVVGSLLLGGNVRRGVDERPTGCDRRHVLKSFESSRWQGTEKLGGPAAKSNGCLHK